LNENDKLEDGYPSKVFAFKENVLEFIKNKKV
jgi:hypothetical protein